MASACLHGFLLLLVVFGSAFFVVKEKPLTYPRLQFIPTKLVEGALAGGGGNPKIAPTDDQIVGDTLKPTPPAATPPRKPPQPKPTPPAPAPVPEVTRPVKPETKPPPKTVDVAKPKPTDKPAPKYSIDLTELQPVTPSDKEKQREKERQKAKAEADVRAAREARQRVDAARERIAQESARVGDALRTGFKSGTKVDVGGPGGEAFANYGALVQAAYADAWRILPDLNDDDAITLVRVTISRDGRVVSSVITRRSGSTAMDRSVQRALDKVRAEGLPPFPDFIKDSERSFNIEFNLKTRRLLG